MRRLGVPGRANRSLDLPVRCQPLKAKQILLLVALLRLNEEGTFRLAIVSTFLHPWLVLALLVPAGCFGSASRIGNRLYLHSLGVKLLGRLLLSPCQATLRSKELLLRSGLLHD